MYNSPPSIRKEVSRMSSLTRAQVIATLGPLDDVIVNAIIGMGPTLGELSEAKAWIANDEAFMNVGKRLACGRVGQLVEILSAIEEEAADEEVVGRT
jgi:hypothetical protein